jgi:hypothetical protein
VKSASGGAPPANDDTVCDDDARFVTTTLIPADMSPTAVLEKVRVVVLNLKAGRA